jgi:hypothetical protein
MNNVMILVTLLSATILASCASTESIVVSNRASIEKIEEGIVYSLPKQLVKVTYTRQAIDSTKAAKAKENAQEAVDTTAKAIKEKEKSEKDIIKLIKNIDPQASNRLELEAKLNLELTKIKAEKLILTKRLAEQKNTLSIVALEYAHSLQSEKAFSEQLKITPESPIADTSHTFYAKVQHHGMYSDTLELKTKNGLLDGAVGHSEDKTGEIVVSLAGGLSELLQPSFLGIGVPKVFRLAVPPFVTERCLKKEAISISQVIDPSNSNDLNLLNNRLYEGCIKIEIDQPNTSQNTALNKLTSANGLIYRQPGIFTFRVKNVDDNSELQSVKLSLSQGGQIGIISMPKGNFSKNEYDVAFNNGILSKSKVIQPSEVLGAVMILPNALREIFAIPTELIQLKVDYSSSEKELIEIKKAMIEAQFEIEKKQIELEELLTTQSVE